MLRAFFLVAVVTLGSVNAFKFQPKSSTSLTRLHYGDAKGQNAAESASSFMVKEFANYEQLQNVVQLASKPLPERPDGIVCVAKFTSATRDDCRATEAEFERMARANPATIFMRCYLEYDGAATLAAQADVSTWPSFDVFSGGNRVSRVEGPNYEELQEVLQNYQFQNSQLDLFSEGADNKKRLEWGDGKLQSTTKTPKTTNRFIPGYDWNSDRGFFDGLADQFEDNFESEYGDWTPNMGDD